MRRSSALRWSSAIARETLSWKSYRDEIFRAAAGFVRLGVVPGTGLAIHSANRPEWAVADLAAIAAGAIPTGIFITNTPEQCAYVLDHTEATIAVADNAEAVAKLLELFSAYERMVALYAELRSYYPRAAGEVEAALPPLSAVAKHGEKAWQNLSE